MDLSLRIHAQDAPLAQREYRANALDDSKSSSFNRLLRACAGKYEEKSPKLKVRRQALKFSPLITPTEMQDFSDDCA